MKRYGKRFILKQDFMDLIAIYMDDEIREKLHFEMAPCKPLDFLKRYISFDPDFEKLLKVEFSLEM